MKIERKHTAEILYVNLKSQFFFSLSCKGVVSRKGNCRFKYCSERIASVIIDFIFLQSIIKKIKMRLLLKGNVIEDNLKQHCKEVHGKAKLVKGQKR